MKVVFFGNNRVGRDVAASLRRAGDEIVAAVLHPPARRAHGEELLEVLDLPAARLFDGSRLREPETVAALSSLGAEMGVSALFGYILRREVIESFPRGCVNLHPSYLPWNRGAHPNVWSIVEGTPAGVTLHYLDEGVDTGDIIARRRVEVEPVDTGQTLYRKLEAAAVALFEESWPLLRSGCAPRLPQPADGGTVHRVAELASLDEVELDRSYTGRELIDLLRARTFPPYAGAWFVQDGRRVELSLELRYADENR